MARGLAWTEYEWANYTRQRQAAPVALPVALQASTTPSYRSKTEAHYAQVLAWRQQAGEIEAWWYEALSLKLAPSTHYRPDFLVLVAEGMPLELHEVKGAWVREKGWQKLKIAAALYPCFTFRLCQRKEGTWHYRVIPSR